MTSRLIKLNQFVKQDNNVYCAKSQANREFAYSDGQEVEHRLRWIFSTVNDLSSTSYELQDHITDWPSEYHLTPVRANLLRALDLSKVSRVLELGCGCGSITRYLGEQSGKQSSIRVDGIEGSPARAEIAALRCRDLPNVTISTANFNDIEFPEDEYDLVLFVGVTEYAGRFSDAATDEQALQDLLALAKHTAKPDGAVVVAIENRTGMKYVMGASEDHYAKPYIGIHDYSEPAGIRTYTKKEWEQQIATANFSKREFIYPFPDYKVPTIFLHENYVDENPYAYVHLEGNKSRDYCTDIFADVGREPLLWEAAVTSKTLGDYANSFLIIMSDSDERLAQLSHYDFVHLPSFQRKLDYCLHIAKPKNQAVIQRRYLANTTPTTPPITTGEIQHQLLENEPYYGGKVLSVEWSRSLISYPDLELFERYLNDYFAFLQSTPNLSIDLLPNNLVLTQSNTYQAFDEEWQLTGELQENLTPLFVYYRAVLFFYCAYPYFVEQKLAVSKNLKTIEDWIYYAFAVIGEPLQANVLYDFYVKNGSFQQAIAYKFEDLDFSVPLLETPTMMTLRWRTEKGMFLLQNYLVMRGNSESGIQSIKCDLPSSVRKLYALQIVPTVDVKAELSAFFRVYRVNVSAVNAQGESVVIWQSDDAAEIADNFICCDLIYENREHGEGYYVTGSTPILEFRLASEVDIGEGQFFRVTIEISYPRSKQFLVAKERYLDNEDFLNTRLAREFSKLKKVLDEAQPIERVEINVIEKLRQDSHELDGIKNSRSWQLILCLRRLVSPLRKVLNAVRFIKQQGVMAYATHIKKKIFSLGQQSAQLVEHKVERSEQKRTTTTFEQWLSHQTKDYWAVFEKLNKPMTLSLILVEEDNRLSVWRRALYSLKKQSALIDPQMKLQLVLLSSNPTLKQTADAIFKENHNVEIHFSDVLADKDVLQAINTVTEMLSGDFVTLACNNDYFAPQYLAEYALKLASESQEKRACDVIYSDDVLMDAQGVANEPYFKPVYSPHLLENTNYIGRNVWIKRQLWCEHVTGDFKAFIISVCQCAKNIQNIEKPLFYKSFVKWDAAKITNIQALDKIKGEPLVSIIIPFRDNSHLLKQCLDSVLTKTSYTNIEIIGVSNDSLSSQTYAAMADYAKQDKRITFHQHNIPFNFSKLVNVGVALAKGEQVVLLNNDIEIISGDWCQQILYFSQREDVGVVGSKLHYPDGRIQHAGIALGVGAERVAAHVYKLSGMNDNGYMNRLKTVNNVMAVTGAMMMVKTSLYRSLGGFDEVLFPVAFNDVDFCLRAWQNGWSNVFTPYALATHYESTTRGYEDTVKKLQRFDIEKGNFIERYRDVIDNGDVYYNRNLHRHREDYAWKVGV